MQMVCIVCPNGCRLNVEQADGQIKVSGNKCKRGETFAVAELTDPMRSVTSSVKTTVRGYPVISVKTDGEIPKSKIFDLINMLAQVTLTQAVAIGTVILPDVFCTGVNVITTTDMEVTNE